TLTPPHTLLSLLSFRLSHRSALPRHPIGGSRGGDGNAAERTCPGASRRHRMTINRIAILRALQLGDLLVAVPALRAIRKAYPGAEITLIGLPWAAGFAQRFRHYIDRFVTFSGYPGLQEMETTPERTERFLAEQRAYGYD